MTVGQLRETLAGLDDDQYVFVDFHIVDGPFFRVQIIVQGVRLVYPWQYDTSKTSLVGLVAHEKNKVVTPQHDWLTVVDTCRR